MTNRSVTRSVHAFCATVLLFLPELVQFGAANRADIHLICSLPWESVERNLQNIVPADLTHAGVPRAVMTQITATTDGNLFTKKTDLDGLVLENRQTERNPTGLNGCRKNYIFKKFKLFQ